MTDRYTRRGNYYVRRPQAQPVADARPFEETPCGLLAAMLVFLSLFIGIPFVLWLVAA